ncbi:hypothetical protein UlMin_007490 [Ulmus minor]
MDPRTNKQFHYNPVEPGNEEFQSSSQSFMSDPLSSTHINMRPPDPNISEAKPGLNYSIQTGEEFEFMRDRVNPWKPMLPNTVGDPNYATGYMELKGILGISHTGSESGSDISMLTMAEKVPTQFERNSSSHEDRSNYASVQSVPRTSSGYESTRGVLQGYASSGTSDSSITKMKVLCSFGGKILPRPSDGRLRYVGGETRIVRIRKDISWRELTQKFLSIYNQSRVIKYQLPGEDLDALVSVSCDEDLQNMMEECRDLESREGSQRLRMFLFSVSDLEDAQLGLSSMDGDSEVQYVVAVNGMDLGSRKISSMRGFASSSGNNLDELDGQSYEKEKTMGMVGPTGVNNAVLTGNIVSSSITPSPESFIPSSSIAYEHHPNSFHGQMHNRKNMQYPLHNSHVNSSHSHNGEVSGSMPFHDIMNQQGYSTEGQQDNKALNYFPVADPSVTVTAAAALHPLSSRNESKYQEPEKVTSLIDSANPPQAPKFGEGDQHPTSSAAFAPAYVRSDSNVSDRSFPEPPVLPQRVYYSERIPREQVELLNRSSKSDDSYGPQFLISHSRSDITQKDPIIEGIDKLHADTNLGPQIEQSNSTSKHTVEDGLAKLQNYKEFADSVAQMNSELMQDVDDRLNLAILNPVDNKDVIKEDSTLSSGQEIITDGSLKGTTEAPVVSQLASVEQLVDPASNPPEQNFCSDKPADHAQPLPHTESSAMHVSQDTSSAGISTTKQGDIIIDIEERFPRDLLSDIFSKAILSEDSPGIGLIHNDGAGLSLNMENREPKRWSYFQRLAQEGFDQKDVSLIDQDHLGFSSMIGKDGEDHRSYPHMVLATDGISQEHGDPQLNFDENHHNIPGPTAADSTTLYPSHVHSPAKDSESVQFGAMMENLKMQESEYEDGNFQTRSAGLPPLDPSLGVFDISTLQAIKDQDLEELKELGSGTFGTVYHGKWRGSDVAIKRIKKSCFTGRSSEQERLTVEFWREADILSKLHHPNVVAFYGVVQDGPGGTLATVTEYMVDGSLRHVLLRKDRYLDRRKRLIIAMDAAFGMEYLHSKNIVHFDLKCDNLLVNLKDPLRPICKVGDFGLSKIKRNTLVSGGVRGTLPWMAPELLNGSSNKVSEKVDVFSFGIVLWEILTGEEPYANMHYGAIIGGIVNNTLRPTIPSHCDSEWRTLMEQCWAPNPAVRPSFTEIASRLRVMSTTAIQTKAQKASK